MIRYDPGEGIEQPALTEREHEVLSYMAEGLTNREIALKMVVALSTVKWYARQIFNKLGVDNRQEAVKRAQALGPLAPGFEERALVGNLPAQFSSFVGREREIAEIRQLLKEARLITLSGAAGSGKTRLALRVAALVTGGYADGAAYVALAGTEDPGLVSGAIAHVLGVHEQPGFPLVQALQRNMAHKRMLLILDNFEHLLAAAPLVTELLAAAPWVTILVTSREALHVSGEYEYLVPPLTLPPVAPDQSLSALLAVESVALFVQRARMASHDFRLTEENATAVARICRRLDGLPLAIELAAPRIKLFSAAQMLERLQGRLGLLVRGPRDLPARQRTLRDTLDWSYNLLDEEEQRLFACLSVFQGGRTIAAVEAVGDAAARSRSPGPGQVGASEWVEEKSFEREAGMLAGLESLLNKNLLYQKEGPGDEPRFYMLETIHEYARERLREQGLQELMQDRHLDYFVEHSEAMAPGYLRHGQLLLFKQTEAEMANIRAAFEWARQSRQFEKGARLITATSYYLRYATDRVVEGYRLTRCLLPQAREISPVYRIPLLVSASELAFQNNDIIRYRRLAQRAQGLAREVGDRRLLAWSLVVIAAFSRDDPEYGGAIKDGREAEGLFRELNDKPGLAYVLNRLGEVYRLGGEFEMAKHCYEESLAICQETGEVIRECFLYGNLGLIAYEESEYQQSKEFFLRALSRPELTEWAHWTITGLRDLAGPLARLGEAQKAARIAGACARLTAELGLAFHPFDQAAIARFEADLRRTLDQKTYAAAWDEGQQMSYAEVVAYALSTDGIID